MTGQNSKAWKRNVQNVAQLLSWFQIAIAEKVSIAFGFYKVHLFLEKALGKTAEKRLLPMQQGDVYETYADTTKAKDLLGFRATTDFEKGIQHFADWFQSYQ